MHRLAVFFHHIVGDIHKIIDRTNAVGCQCALHPLRRRSDLYILDNSCAVARAEFRIFYLYLDIIGGILVVSGLLYLRRTEFFMERRRRFSGDTDHAVTIDTVGSDFILDDRVVQAQCMDGAFPNDCIFRKYIDSILRSLRVKLSGASQFLDGTHHTVRLHAAQFSCLDAGSSLALIAVMISGNHSAVQNHRHLVSLFDIGRSGHDLYRFGSNVYLAYDQLVRIRMLLNLFNLSDHDFFQMLIQTLIILHFCSGQCHRVGIFLRRYIKIRHIHFNP